MRLINARTLELREFFEADLPPYAILSHTWEDGEVTFQDMAAGPDGKRASKKAFAKIRETCGLALEYGLEYAWVDTCCIDKSSSAELTESINSMFRWYAKAHVCFVYLADLASGVDLKEGLAYCRWLTRGWTLQELIAPHDLFFFDSAWSCRGSKENFVDVLHDKTGIDRGILMGETPLSKRSVAHKMSWAASRETARVEDAAYCLLGIFDVHIPLIYGEGKMAFRRLQEEIVKRSIDMTIFGWDPLEDVDRSCGDFVGAFAPSPAAFRLSSAVEQATNAVDDPGFSVTNKGLRVQTILSFLLDKTALHPDVNDAFEPSGVRDMYFLQVGGAESEGPALVMIALRKVGVDLFVRLAVRSFLIQLFDPPQLNAVRESSFYIMTDNLPSRQSVALLRTSGIHFRPQRELEIVAVNPDTHWDHTDRCIFSMKSTEVVPALLVYSSIQSKRFCFIILCAPQFREGYKFKIFEAENDPIRAKLATSLFRLGESGSFSRWIATRRTAMSVHELDTLPELRGLKHYVMVDFDHMVFHVSVEYWTESRKYLHLSVKQVA